MSHLITRPAESSQTLIRSRRLLGSVRPILRRPHRLAQRFPRCRCACFLQVLPTASLDPPCQRGRIYQIEGCGTDPLPTIRSPRVASPNLRIRLRLPCWCRNAVRALSLSWPFRIYDFHEIVSRELYHPAAAVLFHVFAWVEVSIIPARQHIRRDVDSLFCVFGHFPVSVFHVITYAPFGCVSQGPCTLVVFTNCNNQHGLWSVK
jgi:hypothetical protein